MGVGDVAFSQSLRLPEHMGAAGMCPFFRGTFAQLVGDMMSGVPVAQQWKTWEHIEFQDHWAGFG